MRLKATRPRRWWVIGSDKSRRNGQENIAYDEVEPEVIKGALARDETLVSRCQTGCMLPLQLCAITLTSQKPASLSRLTKTRAMAFITMRCR